MNMTKNFVALITTLLSATFIALPGEAKAREVVNFNSAGPLLTNMKDGAALIETMLQKAEALNDYSLVFETITYKNGQTIQEKGKLWFKKPKLMRLEEIGDYQRGSVAVIGKDGMARAHAGGLIKFVTLTLKPDDKQLDAANGDKMEDSDFISLAKILKHRLKQGNLARVSETPVTAGGVDRETLVLELYKAENPKLVLKRIYVDPKTALPVRWDDYDYATPCSSTWSDIKANINLSDDLFKM